MLNQRRWILQQAKVHPQHEPRDGLFMCGTHHRNFDAYNFFIRFSPNVSLKTLASVPNEVF